MITAKLNLEHCNPPRRAFTLIELLVVIAIIVVLISLIIVAVPKALDPANEAATRTDMAQLSAAIQSFQTKFQVSYIPSRIILCKNYVNYFNGGVPSPNNFLTPLHQDSVNYLTHVFPRITIPGAPGPPPGSTGPATA
jgi:prepilin-type N-terminal cleavage/methylation domain-containing protein